MLGSLLFYNHRDIMKSKKRSISGSIILLALLAFSVAPITGQTRGSVTLFGDVRVDESKAGDNKLGTLTILLCSQACSSIIARTSVAPGGRYRFNNIAGNAEYDLVVEVYGSEIARVHIFVGNRPAGD